MINEKELIYFLGKYISEFLKKEEKILDYFKKEKTLSREEYMYMFSKDLEKSIKEGIIIAKSLEQYKNTIRRNRFPIWYKIIKDDFESMVRWSDTEIEGDYKKQYFNSYTEFANMLKANYPISEEVLRAICSHDKDYKGVKN